MGLETHPYAESKKHAYECIDIPSAFVGAPSKSIKISFHGLTNQYILGGQ